MKTKIKDLTGPALDWAVSILEGYDEGWLYRNPDNLPNYSTSWGKAGPIIEREDISIIRVADDWGVDEKGYCNNQRIPVWCATDGQFSTDCTTEHQQHDEMFQIYEDDVTYGPTPLIAAMRCYVASKFGEEVDVPDELSAP